MEPQALAEPGADPEAARSGPAGRLTAALFLLAVAAAGYLRLHDLALKPLHADEGVNGWFLTNLYDGLRGLHWRLQYRYNPTNFHGPFFYFAGLGPFFALGPSVFALRLLPALAGTGCVAVLWPLRRWLGDAGLVGTAFLLALSPPAVYFSRTAIHEIYFVFFTLTAFVALVRCHAAGGGVQGLAARRGWRLAAAVSLALVAANKETWVLTVAVLGLAAWAALAPLRPDLAARIFPPGSWQEYRRALLAAGALLLLLFTSCLQNPRGAVDFFATYGSWLGRAAQGAGHEKPFRYWLDLLWAFDGPILLLAAGGAAVALWRRGRFGRFGRFVMAWAAGLGLVYSLIHYKTPWLLLNLSLPLALLAGLALREIERALGKTGWRGGPAVFAVLLPLLLAAWPVPAGPWLRVEGFAGRSGVVTEWARLGWDVNFVHYDSEEYPIVYVQTQRAFTRLVDRLEALYRREPGLAVAVTAEEYFPLPFYLRDHAGGVSYGGYGPPPTGAAPRVVVASLAPDPALTSRLAGYHREVHALRQGVSLVLWVEPRLWDATFSSAPGS